MTKKNKLAGWTREFKGSERGGAWIFRHPEVPRAIVMNHHGVSFNGQRYASLEDAGRAALTGARTHG